MDIISAYREVGTYRGAAELCATTHKAVRRVIERAEAGDSRPVPAVRVRNYESVTDVPARLLRETNIAAVTAAGSATGHRWVSAGTVGGLRAAPRANPDPRSWTT